MPFGALESWPKHRETKGKRKKIPNFHKNASKYLAKEWRNVRENEPTI